MRGNAWLVAACLLVLSLMFVCGCEEDETPPVVPNDTEAADAIVAEANEELAAILFDLVNSAPEQPSDVDVTAAYLLYHDAVEADADHPGGNFGMGLLEVIMLTQDAETQQFFENLENYFNGDAYFLEEGGIAYSFANPGTFTRPALSFVLAAPAALAGGMTRLTAEYGHSTGDMQTFAREKLIPRVSEALAHLDLVVLDESFEFTVTPKMQGDYDEDPVELDLTEVYAVLVAMNSLNALLNQFVAYDLDLGEYTGADMQEALSRNSSFAALTDDGALRMQTAFVHWNTAVTCFDEGLTFLENESDSQTDDLIRIDPYDGISEADLDSIHVWLPQVQDALDGTVEIEIFDAQGDPYTLEVSLTNFFASPPQNLKALVPDYTVALDVDPDGWPAWDNLEHVESETQPITVTVDHSGNFTWYKYGTYFRGEPHFEDDWRNFDCPELDALFSAKLNQYASEDYLEILINFAQTLTEGENETEVYVDIWTGFVPYRYVPVFTWEADNGEQWIFPDPTISGLFPGMTDSVLKDLVGWTPADFEKTVTWHLWDFWYFDF